MTDASKSGAAGPSSIDGAALAVFLRSTIRARGVGEDSGAHGRECQGFSSHEKVTAAVSVAPVENGVCREHASR